MMHITRVWLCLGLTWLAVAARYLPTPELIVDSLVPFSAADSSRLIRSVQTEGSGDDMPIVPMPEEYNRYMERMQASPSDHTTSTLDQEEGSGSEPIALAGTMKDIDDPIKETFAKEPGMHEVLEELDNNSKPVGLPQEDDNRQGNSLNVLPSEDRPQSRLEEEERGELLEEGSGAPDTDETYDATNVSIIDLDNEKTLSLDHEVENVTLSQVPPVDENGSAEHSESSTPPSEEIATTFQEELMTTRSSIEIQPVDVMELSPEPTESESPDETTTEQNRPDSTVSVALASSEPSTNAVEPELEMEKSASTIGETATEVRIPVMPASSESPPESSETSTPVSSADEKTTPASDVEIVESEQKVVLTAAKEATMLESSPKAIDEASGPQTLSTFIMIGALIVAFMSLLIFIVLRNRRKRRRNLHDESTTEGDTTKTLLTNGKYKPEGDEVKNNEISPLVINKFEKSPNFSSQKNLNTTANDKNIEKDNVLKQAIIEDEVEEAKRAKGEENEECKRAAEELKYDSGSGDAEKVVVRTHIDLDSIPRKPLIITKNGNAYHSVPNGET